MSSPAVNLEEVRGDIAVAASRNERRNRPTDGLVQHRSQAERLEAEPASRSVQDRGSSECAEHDDLARQPRVPQADDGSPSVLRTAEMQCARTQREQPEDQRIQ